jgi:hypothetical protein
VDKLALRYAIALSDPADLPLADCMHRLIALDGSTSPLDRAEPEACRNPLLNESVVLLDDVIQIWRCSAATVATEFTSLLQFSDCAGISRVPIAQVYRRPLANLSASRIALPKSPPPTAFALACCWRRWIPIPPGESPGWLAGRIGEGKMQWACRRLHWFHPGKSYLPRLWGERVFHAGGKESAGAQCVSVPASIPDRP